MTVAAPVASDSSMVVDAPTYRPIIVAITLMVAAIISAAVLLGRPLAAVDLDDYAAVAPVRNAYWLFSMVAAISMGITYMATGLAGCLLITRRAAGLATFAAVLLSVGAVAFASGFFALGAATWFTTGAVTGDATFFDYFQEHSIRAFGPQMTGFLLIAIGILMLGVALWRSRVVPRWLAIGIPVSFVIMILGGTGIVYDLLHAVFMATLVVLAWHLLQVSRARP